MLAPMRVLAVVVLLPLLSGCALLRDLLAVSHEPPSARFAGATVQDATLDGARLDVRFALENPGPLALRLSNVQVQVEVDGAPVAVPPPQPLTVPAGGRSELSIPVPLTFANASKDALRIRVSGAATASTPTGPVSLPLMHEEMVAVAKEPKIALGFPKLTSLGFTSAGLELPLTVENPNPYALGLTSLDGVIGIGATKLGGVNQTDLGQVGAGEKKELTVHLTLQFASLAAALFSGTNAPLELSSQLKSGTQVLPVKLSQPFELPRPPKLSFGGVALSDVSLEGATLELKYAVDNPNPLPISLGEVKYALNVEGKSIATGGPAPNTEIAANAKTDVTAKARVQFLELATSLPALLQKDAAKFSFQGSLGSKAGDALPLSHASTFALPKLPSVTVGTPKLAGMDFTTARIELPLTVKNANGFDLDLGSLAGAILLSGTKVGDVNTGALGLLKAGQPRTISVPLNLQLANTVVAAAALRGGTLPLSFDGQLQAGAVTAPVQWSKSLQLSR